MADQNSIYCPNCHKYTSIMPRVNYAWPKNNDIRYEICECNACDFFVLVQKIKGHIARIFPTPLPKPVDERIPTLIRSDLIEAILCSSVGAHRGSAVLARRALQNICLV